MKLFLSSALLGILFLFAPHASADTFSFSYSSSLLGYNGSGTLTASALGNGSYSVTSATGTNILGLLPSGTYDGNDNLIFPSATQTLDAHGLALSILSSSGNYQIDLYSSILGYFGLVTSATTTNQLVPLSFNLGAPQADPVNPVMTPEPGSLVLLGTGMIIVALFALKQASRNEALREAPGSN